MIDKYVEDIKASLENKRYYAALSLALILPDICGSVEFPNKEIHERYIGWYDRYIGESLKNEAPEYEYGKAYLSGEIVYNLRNTFLHSGQADIDSKKVKDESNQIDKFVLYVSEEAPFEEVTLTGKIDASTFKGILVDVKYLCGRICDSAIEYYRAKIDRFSFASKIYACNTLEDLGISLRKALDEIYEDHLRRSHE